MRFYYTLKYSVYTDEQKSDMKFLSGGNQIDMGGKYGIK